MSQLVGRAAAKIGDVKLELPGLRRIGQKRQPAAVGRPGDIMPGWRRSRPGRIEAARRALRSSEVGNVDLGVLLDQARRRPSGEIATSRNSRRARSEFMAARRSGFVSASGLAGGRARSRHTASHPSRLVLISSSFLRCDYSRWAVPSTTAGWVPVDSRPSFVHTTNHPSSNRGLAEVQLRHAAGGISIPEAEKNPIWKMEDSHEKKPG